MLHRVSTNHNVLFPVSRDIDQHLRKFRRSLLLGAQPIHDIVFDDIFDIVVFSGTDIIGQPPPILLLQPVGKRLHQFQAFCAIPARRADPAADTGAPLRYRSPGGNRGRRCFPGHRGNGFLRIPAGRNQQNSGNRRNRKPGSGKKQTISSLFHRRSPMYSLS